MLDWIGVPVGALCALVPVFALRALIFALYRRGRRALANLGVAALCLVLGLTLFATGSYLLQAPAQDPTDGFRSLAATAIQIAFDALWIAALGLPLSVASAWHAHRSRT